MPDFREWLKAKGGKVSFETFMEAALGDPDFGYYTSAVKNVGPRGDFSTSATIHPVMARAIARWLEQNAPRVFGHKSWHIIEVGAGTGAMVQNVLRSLPLWRSWFTHVHLVEMSPSLRAKQRRRLRRFRCSWHDSIEQALEKCGGKALIYSNEFVDAFPCIQIVWKNGAWKEVALELAGDVVREQLVDFGPERLDPGQFSIFSTLTNPVEGQRCELHDSHRRWLSRWAGLLKCGAVLTVDYGESAGDLYERRPSGTIRAYFRHQVLQGLQVYQRFGRQDLTADVNFTDLINWGETEGFQTEFYTTQRDFIKAHVSTASETVDEMLRIRQLTDEAGAGGSFKVLCQSVGLEG